LGTTPLLNWAICRAQALYAATSVDLAERSTSVETVSILSAKVDADTSDRVAVGVGTHGRGTIVGFAGASASVLSAISAETIIVAV